MVHSAQAAVTVSWNTRSPAQATSGDAPVRTATVLHVSGTHVLLRMSDGTTRIYLATPQQAHELEQLVGSAVQFRLAGTGHK